jgi:hypothetical protein
VCCKDHQYEICGAGGVCDTQYTLAANKYVMVCSYSVPCEIWAHQCPSDEACLLEGQDDGTGACATASSIDGFKKEGDPCQYKNDCGDNLICVTSSGTETCRYLCKLGDSPWDAGSPDAGAGSGGCPSGMTCNKLSNVPSWMGVCTP